MPAPFQARTERDLKRPGYCAIHNEESVISLVATEKLRKGEEITAKRLLNEFGISRAEIYLVIAALRHQGFIDEQNHITDTLDELAHATGEEYTTKFQRVIAESYADVYDYGLDPAQATQADFLEAFQACEYEPVNTLPKMVSLFKGLCRLAGILPDESKEVSSGSEQEINSLPPLSPLNTDLVVVEDTIMLKQPQSNGVHHVQTDFTRVEKAVASFVKLHQLAQKAEWNEANRAMWMEYVRMSYDFLGDALLQIERTEQ